eukprot:scaffold18071_cov65-Phaeocystis_antarctica.AAC.2
MDDRAHLCIHLLNGDDIVRCHLVLRATKLHDRKSRGWRGQGRERVAGAASGSTAAEAQPRRWPSEPTGSRDRASSAAGRPGIGPTTLLPRRANIRVQPKPAVVRAQLPRSCEGV